MELTQDTTASQKTFENITIIFWFRSSARPSPTDIERWLDSRRRRRRTRSSHTDDEKCSECPILTADRII